jgi:hypothetical protein
MARYKGTVTQSILDWYAAQAMAAQQWFSSATPNYWAFSLINNAIDGRRLWVYDAETVSGAAFPAGTGNPGGNPNAVVGYQGGGSPAATFALISSSVNELNTVNSLPVPVPASIIAGNLCVVFITCGGFAASFIHPPDATWTRLAGADGNVNSPAAAAFGHIATSSEPTNWTFDTTGAAASAIIGEAMQFSGNVNPVALDAANGAVSTGTSNAIPAPALTLTATGDLVLGLWAAYISPTSVLTGDPSFTLQSSRAGYGVRQWIGFKTIRTIGPVGPFIGSTTVAENWTALSVAMKPSNVGAAPGQVLSAPIGSVTPTQPGLLTLGFSGAPLAFGGVTRWIPPASHFEWHREAPLAVLQTGDQFNLAGIAPENGAWGSVTWLAIK